MIQPPTQQQSNPDTRPRWFNAPVAFHEGRLSDIRRHIPDFERRSFALTQPGNELTRINDRLDTIVRKPFGKDHNFIPVGVVSWLGSDQGNYMIFQIYVKKKGLFSRLELQSITWARPQVEASPGDSARWKEERID